MLLKRITQSRDSSRSPSSESEQLEQLNKQFDRMDSNRDGVIDRAEFVAAMAHPPHLSPSSAITPTPSTPPIHSRSAALTGQCTCELGGHSGAVLGCAANSLGIMVSGGADGTVRMWTRDQTEATHTFWGNSAVTSCCVSNDGKIAAGSRDGFVRVWSVSANQPLATFRHSVQQPVLAVRFGHAGSDDELVSAGADGVLRLWTVNGKACITHAQGHTGAAHAIDVGPSGVLASGGDDLMVRLWSRSGLSRLEGTDLSGHTSEVLCVSFSPNERLLASGGADNAILLFKWRIPGAAVVVLENVHSSIVKSVAFASSGYVSPNHSLLIDAAAELLFLCWQKAPRVLW